MKIVAFAGSSSSKSINRELVQYVLKYFEGHEINLLDLNDYEMPIFSVDKENNGIPNQAHQFRQAFKDADAIICSMAEHNRAYTAAFKNIFDWSSRVDMAIFAGKPMLLMSTSPGGFGGGNVMNLASSFFPKCGANVVDTFSMPSFYKNFVDGEIIDETIKIDLLQKIEQFKQSTQ